MTRRYQILLLVLPLAAAACSKEKAPPVDQQPRTPAEKTVFDTQLKALQKAKDVQNTAEQQAAEQNKKLEDESH